MILSTSHEATLALLATAMVFGALWPNTLKMIKRWRFELYFCDFTWGFLVIAVLAAFSLGSLNSHDLTFQDNLAIAGYRKIAYCLVAGFTFGLGGFLLAGAIALTGMAVAFVISLGVSGVITIAVALASGVRTGTVLMTAGAVAVMAAVVIAAYTHSARADAILDRLQNTPLRPDPREAASKKIARPPSAARGIMLGVLGGIFLGLFPVILDLGRSSEDGVAAYGAALLFAIGLASAMIFFSPFFWNFPAMGRALRLRDYLKGNWRNHFLGLVGGLIAGAALVASFVAHSAAVRAQPSAGLGFAMDNGDVILAALLGLLAWDEFHEAEGKTAMLFATSVVAFAIGIALAAFGQA